MFRTRLLGRAVGLMGISENLTDKQWELLEVLVSRHESNGGAEFHFACNFGGCGITYPGGVSVPGVYDQTDLIQLGAERLVTLIGLAGNLHRGKPTQPGIDAVRRHFGKSGEQSAAADSKFWRDRREEFERLPLGEYTLFWSTCRPTSPDGKLLESQWSWWRFPDMSLRARLSAIALKCAKGLRLDSEDGWFDRLREADFVRFELNASGRQKQPDGSMVDYQAGALNDIAKHSITLCHVLEAAGSPHQAELGGDKSEIPQKPKDLFEAAILKSEGSIPFQGITQRRIFMNPPSHMEIEKLAIEIFGAGIEDRTDGYAKHQAKVLSDARLTNNAGAYLPALIKCKQDRLRAEILLLADAWVESATIYAVALGKWAQKALEKAATQMAGGTNSAIRGGLDLHATRTRTPRSNSGGEREIHNAMKLALREANLKLKTQRIKAERSLRLVPLSGMQSGAKPAKPPETALPRNVEVEPISERAQRRKKALDPILKSKLMNVNQWADAASAEGVSHSTVFRYYNGETNPRISTLEALARPLGLTAEGLPR